MLQLFLTVIGGYLIGNSIKPKVFAEGGEVDLILLHSYSGKKVRDIVSEYDSQEGTDMKEFAIDNIKLKDKYILDYVNIEGVIENDSILHTYISQEYEPKNEVEYKAIEKPILLGNKNLVVDGFHRILQALYNKEDEILSFIKLGNNSDIRFKHGGTIAQTPAPKSDRIYGSKVNPKGSASSSSTASKIVLSEKIIDTLKKKLSENKNDNVTLNDLKAVYRRGLGAYSTSHRPTISGGKPNSRNAWAMARVNKFLLKASGVKVKKAYVQDDDLLK